MKKTKSSFITTQVILSQRNKHDNLIDCVLSDQIMIATIRNEEISKKKRRRKSRRKESYSKKTKE
jgi:hypothetical protein